MPNPTNGPFGEDLNRYFGDMFQMMAMAREAWSSGNPYTGMLGITGENASEGQDVMDFMKQAYLACMSSYFRAWGRLVELHGNHAPTIIEHLSEMNADPNQNREARGVLIDTLRAYFRELSELPEQESRTLQAELAKIEQAFWTAEGEPSAQARRRVHIKL